MAWVQFATKAECTAAIDAVNADLGIPHPGERQSDGETMLENQWTVAPFRPVMDGTTIKAHVPDAWANTFGWTLTTAPPEPVNIADPPTTIKVSWDNEIDKPLPDTWGGKPVPRPIVVVK